MDKDKYGEIINGTNTYKEIANMLRRHEAVIIGWTDEDYTHLDLLFNYQANKEQCNILQRGLRGNELYVSIISIGAFGFDIDTEKSSGYISEKLNIHGQPTVDKLADLINGIIDEIAK
ncbi:MAG: hypothetical protein ACI4UX_05755 [Clostridia bacterium]